MEVIGASPKRCVFCNQLPSGALSDHLTVCAARLRMEQNVRSASGTGEPNRFTEGEGGEGLPQGPPVIDNDGMMDWYLSKLAAFEAEKATVEENCKLIVEKIARDRASLEARYQQQAEDYARRKVIEAKGKSKTFQFLHGKAAVRHVGMEVRIVDVKAATEAVQNADINDDLFWCGSCVPVDPKFVLNKEMYVALTAPKPEVDQETGEVTYTLMNDLPGVELVLEHEAVKLYPGSPKKEQGEANA